MIDVTNKYMNLAIEQARLAERHGEVPVGAVLVSPQGDVAVKSANSMICSCDPTAHAEILAIRSGCASMGTMRLDGFDLYVTLEPCAMCTGAISHARIARLYFGAYDPKSGGVENGSCFFSQPQCHFRPQIFGGILEMETGKIIQEFFQKLR